MGYANTRVAVKTYFPSATVIVNDSAEVTGVEVVPTKVKEIELVSDVGSTSLFRFTFDLRCTNNIRNAFGRVYRNGVAIGTLQSRNSNIYDTKTEDIASTNWNIGDVVQLYGYTSGADDAYWIRNFSICGDGSEWEVNL